MIHNPDGEAMLDPKPMQPPLGYKRQPSLADQIRQQVLAAKLEALDALEETEEEADDFEVGEDFEPVSPHENDHIPSIRDLKKKAKEINDQIKQRNMANLRRQLEKESEDIKASQKKKGAVAPASEASEKTDL